MTLPLPLCMSSAVEFLRRRFVGIITRTCIVVMIGLPFMDASANPANELMDRQVTQDEVAALFHTGNFRLLDRISNQYLKNEERTSSGLWKLTLFYAALESIPNLNVTDNEYWENLENKALKWVSSNPNSPTGHLAYATILKSHAWMYRGVGFASEVRPEDWKPFRDYIAKTRKYLEAHKKVASKDPYWYQLMIHVSTAESWSLGDFNALVDESTSRHPYFYQAYFAAINYLTPRWHGSKEEIENFARKAVDVTREKEGESMYARIYWYASQVNYGNSLFTDSKVVWEKMSKSIDDVLKRYPDQWNINNFAHFACLAHDAQKTKQLIERIEGKPIIEAWDSLSIFNACREWSSTQEKKQVVEPPAGVLI